MQENEWNVLDKVLNDLPSVLQNQMDLLQKTTFSQRIFNLVSDKKHLIKQTSTNYSSNKVLNLTKQKQEYLYKLYPIISSLTLYHFYLDKPSQVRDPILLIPKIKLTFTF